MCVIIVSVGAPNGFSVPFYYTYINKRKAADHKDQPLFCVKNFLEKSLQNIWWFKIFAISLHRFSAKKLAVMKMVL